MSTNLVWYFLSVKGRVSRQEYWLGWGLVMLAALLLRRHLTDLSVYLRQPPRALWYRDELELALAMPRLVIAGSLTWPLAAICVKRLHDLNLSGWWLLLFAAISLTAALTIAGSGAYLTWAGIIIVGVLPSMRGNNQFGDDPLAHKRAAQKP